MEFQVTHRGSHHKERAGLLLLRRGPVKTPVFMPVGTQGMVKTLSPEEVKSLNFPLILSNTYHLYLRPGTDVLKSFSGLHNFVKWDGNILTDSGGYQAFSLAANTKIRDDGILFRSHIDGSEHHFTPQKVLEIQDVIGSEIVMPIDDCTPPKITKDQAIAAHLRTLQWAKESKSFFDREMSQKGSTLFAITQGNFYEDVRKMSINSLVDLEFKGYAIGGVSVGEEKSLTRDIIDFSTDYLPENKPRYLMGVGKPSDLFHGVMAGIDMFDSVYPTRVARNATVFTGEGPLILKNSTNTFNHSPIDESCDCIVCKNFSRGYLRHLFRAGEILGLRLATFHNLHFLSKLMEEIRQSIEKDNFKELLRSRARLIES